MFKARRLLYHSTLSTRAIQQNKKVGGTPADGGSPAATRHSSAPHIKVNATNQQLHNTLQRSHTEIIQKSIFHSFCFSLSRYITPALSVGVKVALEHFRFTMTDTPGQGSLSIYSTDLYMGVIVFRCSDALFPPTHKADGHTGLPGHFRPDTDHFTDTLSVATTVSLYGTAYRRTSGLIGSGLFKKALSSALCGTRGVGGTASHAYLTQRIDQMVLGSQPPHKIVNFLF